MSRDPFDRSLSPNQPPKQDMKSAQETAENLKDRLKDVSSNVRDKASQVASNVTETIDRQRKTAASGLDKAASSLHENAERIPGGSQAVNAGHRIAEGMESTAHYLREHDFSDMGKDVVDLCRRYPIQSLTAALAIGFLIGRSRRD